MTAPCDQCISGTIHDGQPQGKEETIHGLNTYVIGNRVDPRGIIVVYSDVFGLALPNNKIIADSYAKSGEYLVYLPDFFNDDPMKLNMADVLIPVNASKQSTLGKYTGMLAGVPGFVMWQGRHKHEATDRDCMNFLKALRTATPKSQKVGMVGFCWGGRYAIRAGLDSNMIEVEGAKVPLVDAVVALHPSNMVLPQDVETPVVPITYGWGLEDSFVKIEQKGKVEAIHENSKKAEKTLPASEHKVYKPGRHGFAVRGNPDDPQERRCLEDSHKQVLEWFAKWL